MTYIEKNLPKGKLTKQQTQKIVTGLAARIPMQDAA